MIHVTIHTDFPTDTGIFRLLSLISKRVRVDEEGNLVIEFKDRAPAQALASEARDLGMRATVEEL